MKKLALAFGVLLMVLLLAVIAVAMMLPGEGSFTNEIEIAAPPEKVWQVLADKKRYTEWQTQLDRVEVIDESTWVEYLKDAPDPMRFKLLNDARPDSMEFEYSMGDAMHGHWSGQATRTAGGTRLTTTDRYKANGLLSKLVMGTVFNLDGFAKDWNARLKQRVESQPD